MVGFSHSIWFTCVCEIWVFLLSKTKSKMFYLAPLIASVLVLGLSVRPSFSGSPWWTHNAPREYWGAFLNLFSGGKKKPMSEWLTRTEKAPERPELPRLDSSVSIPLLARITWRWNKMTLAFLVLFQQANSPNSSSALGASPAEGLCSCRGWGESRNRRGIWIYACSSSYSLLEPRVVCSCRSTETKQAQNRIESLSNYRLHPHNNSTAFQSTIFGGKIP